MSVVEEAEAVAQNAELVRRRTTVWRDSEEFDELFGRRRGFRASGALFLMYAAVLILGAIMALSYRASAFERVGPVESNTSAALRLVAIFALGLALVLLIYVGARYGTARFAYLERVRHEKSVAVEEALATAATSLSLGDLFVLNRRQLDEYHVLSVRQQKQAFRAAQAASLISFTILAIGAVVTLRQVSPATQIAGGVLTVVGSTLSAFVASVFFRSYNSSSDLLKDYYEEPFRTSRVLTLQRVLVNSGLEEPARSAAWAKLLDTLNSDFVKNVGSGLGDRPGEASNAQDEDQAQQPSEKPRKSP